MLIKRNFTKYTGLGLKGALFLLVLVVGCAKHEEKHLPDEIVDIQEKKNVIVQKKVLSNNAFKNIFCKKCKNIIKKGYQPLILDITNNSDKTYTLDEYNLDLTVEYPLSVAKKLYRNVPLRVTIWSFASLFIPVFIPFAVYDGISSHEFNKDLSQDFESKCISPDDKIIIHSHSTISKLIFTRKENYKDRFEFLLLDMQNSDNKLDFYC